LFEQWLNMEVKFSGDIIEEHDTIF
jgi:hypothetical protein